MANNRLLALGAIACVGVVALGAALMIWQKLSGQSDLDREIALAKKEGVWLDDFTGLSPSPRPSQNAGPLYELAFSQLSQIQGSGTEDVDERMLTPAYLAQNAKALSTAQKGSLLPSCAFSTAHSPTANLEMLRKAKNLVTLFGYRATLEARSGKVDEAVADLTTAARISHHIGQSPLLVAMQERIGADDIVCNDVEEIACKSKPFAAKAGGVVVALGQDPEPLTKLHQELALVCETIASGGNAEPKAGDLKKLSPSDQKRLIAAIHGYREFFAGGAISFNFRGMQESMAEIGSNAPADSIIARQFTDFNHIFADASEDMSRRRATLQGLAILQSASIPKSLPLGGVEAIDPFEHNPLGYLPDAKRFIIFAVSDRLSKDHQPAGVPPGSAVVFQYP